MARFITTINFTDQGVRNIQDTTKRAEAFRQAAHAMDCEIADIYWTMGSFDGVVIFDAPDNETASALMLDLSARGNVKTQTTRAFVTGEIEGILSRTQK